MYEQEAKQGGLVLGTQESKMQEIVSRFRNLTDRFQTTIIRSGTCADKIHKYAEPENPTSEQLAKSPNQCAFDELWEIIHIMERQACDMEKHVRHLEEIV